MSKLYLFTANYPYGRIETFLEDEIEYLSKEFDSVEIIPLSSRTSYKRAVPNNCIVWDPIIKSRKQQYTKGLFCLRSFPLFISEFFRYSVFLNWKRMKTWMIGLSIANNLLKSKSIKALFARIQKDDVCYFYWGKGSNLLSVFYRGRAHFVSRFHGEWDLWEESSGNYAPLRRMLSQSLELCTFISNKGEAYFRERYIPIRTLVSPLGANDYGISSKSRDGYLRVVSCSTIYPLKRVPLIFSTLRSMKGKRIIWTHLGGGDQYEALKEFVKQNLREDLVVHLPGEIKHEEVLSYYKNNQVDIFINVSENEGVPVSIMEAISFDIPVIATNVGGNSEIVTEATGKLVSSNPTIDELSEAILYVSTHTFSPRDYWKGHYCAETNYSSFARVLKQL